MDVDQFQPVSAPGTSDGVEQTVSDDEVEISAVVELNDETGAFEYTLFSQSAPPNIKLYVPGTIRSVLMIIIIIITFPRG